MIYLIYYLARKSAKSILYVCVIMVVCISSCKNGILGDLILRDPTPDEGKDIILHTNVQKYEITLEYILTYYSNAFLPQAIGIVIKSMNFAHHDIY